MNMTVWDNVSVWPDVWPQNKKSKERSGCAYIRPSVRTLSDVPVSSSTTPEWHLGYQYAALLPLNDTQGTSMQLYYPEWHPGYWYAALRPLNDTQGTNTRLYHPRMTLRVPVSALPLCMTPRVPIRSSTSLEWHPGYQYEALPPMNDTQGTSTQLYDPEWHPGYQ